MRCDCILRVAVLAAAIVSSDAARAEDTVLSTTIDGVDIRMWIPEGVKVLRGAIANPADVSVGAGGAWAEVFRNLDFGHVGMMLQNMNRGSRATIIRKALEAALKEFGAKSGHPEFETMPLVFGGMSKGGGWSRDVALAIPQRAVAYSNVCCWVADAEKAGEAGRKVPAVFVIGSVPDGFKMLDAIPAQYDPGRRAGALWMLALQWGAAHDYHNANALAMPFLEAMIRARLPRETPAAGPVKLAELKEDDGWLGDRATWEGHWATIAPWAEYQGDKAAAVWLPNRAIACVWRAFVSKDPPVRLDVSTADGAVKLPAGPKRQMVVESGAAMVLEAVATEGTGVKKVQFYDGDALIGEAVRGPWQATWKNPPSGAHGVFAVWYSADDKPAASNPGLVVVRRGPGSGKS